MTYKNKQCEALTKKGAQCKSGAMPNEDYCGPHLPLRTQDCYECGKKGEGRFEFKYSSGEKYMLCDECYSEADNMRQDKWCTVPDCEEVAYRDEVLCQDHLDQAYSELENQLNEGNNYGHDQDCPVVPCICDQPEEEEMPDKKKTIYITITGHRPNKLGGYDPKAELNVKVGAALERKMLNAVEKFTDDDTQVVFRIGMAIGVDQMAAWICVRHNLPFDAYTPCDGQENRWPTKVQDEYRTLLTYARNVYKTHDGSYPGAWVMQRRNEQMIDGVDGVKADYLLSVYDGTSGGTANCVAYARGKGVTEVNINPTKL